MHKANALAPEPPVQDQPLRLTATWLVHNGSGARMTASNNATALRQMGLTAEPGFLSRSICAQLCCEIDSSNKVEAEVGRAGQSLVDKTERRCARADLSSKTVDWVYSALRELSGKLSIHFGQMLTDCERPQFLRYKPGDLFRPHRDVAEQADAPQVMRERLVSSVIFLNDAGDYGTDLGCLTLHTSGSGEIPRTESYPITIFPEAGLLVAFRADALHEVHAVKTGNRYTIVTWYH